MRDLLLAVRLRRAGLTTVEVDGWQTRGSAVFDPRGSVNHHTAGSPNGAAPSLAVCINGRSDVPGPLCQVLQSREPDGNDKFYVLASGRANHAGRGGWKGLQGNSSVFGLEIEHVGTVPLPDHRQRLAARAHAVFAAGRWSASMVCQHREWAPNRKIDAATNVDPDRFRVWVNEAMGAPSPNPPGWEDDMPSGAQMMATTPSGQGYWVCGSDGGVFSYGDAPFKGGLGGQPINAPIVGITATPSGQGYWLLGQDGGVFAFGDAPFKGAPTGKVR